MPDVFELSEDGVLQVLRVDEARRCALEEVALPCPTQAIRVSDD